MTMPSSSELSTRRVARSAADIRDWIVSQLSGSLNVESSTIDPAAPLGSLGIDSLAAIGMAGGLAGWLDRDLPATLMWDYPSIDAIADGLADRETPAEAAARRGVVVLQPHGERHPVFFLHGLGGHPVTFAALAARLGPPHPCYGLTAPGLNGERELPTRVEEIAAALLEIVRLVQPKGPYQLAGYSFGGLVAYEIAQQLVAAGASVSMLAIYDAFTPAGQAARPPWQRFALHACRLATRPGRVQYVRGRLRRWRDVAGSSGTKTAVDEGDATNGAIATRAARFKEVVRMNKRAAASYQPRPYPGPVLLFRAAARPAYSVFYKLDASNGWGAIARGGVRVIELPGDHLGLLDAAHAPAAAEALRPYLS